MPNKILIGAGIAVILIALGAGYFAYNNFIKVNPPSTTKTQTADQTEEPNQSPSSVQGSLKSLLSQNNINCKTTFPDNGGKGEVFVSNGKMRADITNSIDNKPLLTHLILSGEDFYMWQEGQTTGTKMEIDLNAATSATAGGTQTKEDASANLEAQVDLKCSPWTPDQTKFTPPSNIKFQDFSALMAPSASGTPTIDKSVCDQIADPASKEACLDALP